MPRTVQAHPMLSCSLAPSSPQQREQKPLFITTLRGGGGGRGVFPSQPETLPSRTWSLNFPDNFPFVTACAARPHRKVSGQGTRSVVTRSSAAEPGAEPASQIAPEGTALRLSGSPFGAGSKVSLCLYLFLIGTEHGGGIINFVQPANISRKVKHVDISK